MYLKADENQNTLLPFRYKRHFKAEHGGPGRKQKMHGKSGQDLTLTVPVGTVVYDDETGEVMADLSRHREKALVARGGRGGLGNTHFSTSTYQTPRFAEKGEPGEERRLRLELKLLADVALAGFPNAGKSTLISSISAATPKIAPYPFTTLEPALGVVGVPDSEDSFIVADIPGLVEGAHRGVGLGHEFLRHIERTRVILFVMDGSGLEGRSPLEDLRVVRRELDLYRPDLAQRPALVAFNKMDLAEAQENWNALRASDGLDGLEAVPVSGVARIGLDVLVRRLAEEVAKAPQPVRFAPEETEVTLRPRPVDVSRYEIRRRGSRTWEVTGPSIERIAVMTDMENEEAVNRLEREMNRMGITRDLEQSGIEPGHTLRIGPVEIEWGD